MSRYELLLLLLRYRDMALFQKKYSMDNLKICDRCDDLGYLVGTSRCETNPALNKSWQEVCPYCMPTNKYGNLKEKLKLAPKLLDYKDPESDE